MRRSTAFLLVRNLAHYRREAFAAGLERAGFAVAFAPAGRPHRDDALVIWNRYGTNDRLAGEFERAGAAVIVAENAYLDVRGARKSFALALNHHNGAGDWHVGEERRAPLLDAEIRPWRGDGRRDDVLLLPQRGIGPKGVAMPRDWVQTVQARLASAGVGRRRIRVRPHPGTQRCVRPLDDDLDGIGLCVTWGSGAGVKTLLLGVPTLHELAEWIGAPGGSYGTGTLPAPRLGDRATMLERLAWAQWSIGEVESGEPFVHLLALHREMRKIGDRLQV